MYNIRDFSIKIKGFLYEAKEELLLGLIILLVGTASFGLGRISKGDPAKVETNQIAGIGGLNKIPEATSEVKAEVVEEIEGGEVVASKNGKKYHYPWCGGAKQISEKNKIFFKTTEEARAKGYTPAANCKGLK